MKSITSPRGANATRSRDHNRRLVLGHLHASGALGRAELARRSGLTTQAVSNIIAELEQDGLLRPEGILAGRRGLPAMQYAVNAGGAFAFGVEIRSNVLLAVLTDLTGAAVWQRRLSLGAATPDAVSAALDRLLGHVLRQVPAARDRLLGAGVVMPGPFGRTGVSGTGSDLPGWEKIDAQALLGRTLGMPVTVENGANAAAISERVAGAVDGLTDFACLYFGAGLGLDLVGDGRLIGGAFGNAGEIGHIPVQAANGPVPLESVFNRLSAERALAAANTEAQDIETLQKLFETSNPDLMGWLDSALAPLSQAVALIENMFDPQTIVLCGVMPAPMVRYLIDHVDLPTRRVSWRADRVHPALRLGRCGRMTATLGAAALVLNQTFTPVLAN